MSSHRFKRVSDVDTPPVDRATFFIFNTKKEAKIKFEDGTTITLPTDTSKISMDAITDPAVDAAVTTAKIDELEEQLLL